MPTQTRPTKAERREEARLTAERLRAEQARKARRQRIVISAVVIAVLALVTLLVVMILSQADNPAEAPEVAPQGSLADGAIPVGPDGAAGSTDGAAEDAVVVAVYSDYLCSYCALFEELNGPVLDELRADGDVVVHYHPISIMDGASQGAEYSTRAVAAVALVAELAPDSFVAFHHALMANQPTEVAAFADTAIAGVAEESGVPADVVVLIAAGAHMDGEQSMRPWVGWATDRAEEDLPRLATPAILLNGEFLEADWTDEAVFREAIEAAAAGAGSDTEG